MAVEVSRDEAGVALVTVSRPEALNSLNTETNRELLRVATMLAEEPEVRAVVLTGGGEKAFVAGADIAEMSGMRCEQARQFSLLGARMCQAIEGAPQQWVAAVNGFALGGGCELALACDMRLAAETAKFGQPEIGLGITPGFGGTQRLARSVGLGWAKYLCFSGRVIRADEALRIGLVQGVFPKDELMEQAMKLAHELAAKSPLVMNYMKQAVGRALDLDIDAGHQVERDLFALCFASEDQKEGMGAFLEKRPPRFTGH
jgi:enoyl-CoA hydratase